MTVSIHTRGHRGAVGPRALIGQSRATPAGLLPGLPAQPRTRPGVANVCGAPTAEGLGAYTIVHISAGLSRPVLSHSAAFPDFLRRAWAEESGIAEDARVPRCHCWLAQQCLKVARTTLLDEPAVPPAGGGRMGKRPGRVARAACQPVLSGRKSRLSVQELCWEAVDLR